MSQPTSLPSVLHWYLTRFNPFAGPELAYYTPNTLNTLPRPVLEEFHVLTHCLFFPVVKAQLRVSPSHLLLNPSSFRILSSKPS